MSTITKKMTKEKIDSLYKRLLPFSTRNTRPPYTYWQLKTSEAVVTAYESGKVVFQGKDLSYLEDEPDSSVQNAKSSVIQSSGAPKGADNQSLATTFPMAGSDEVGTGDYFGPVIVCAAYIPDQAIAARLTDMKITDSKAMSDPQIRKVGPEIENMIPYALMEVDNERYNRIYDPTRMNLNRIKARLHNQGYLRLQKQGVTLPEKSIVDQFCAPSTYYSHLKGVPVVFDRLHFETKAESHYLAVAAASVIARYEFLKAWDAMEERYGMSFAKGGGKEADRCGKQFIERYGKEKLHEVAKLHFANTKKIGAD